MVIDEICTLLNKKNLTAVDPSDRYLNEAKRAN